MSEASTVRADVSLSTEVSPRRVEVGSRFVLRLRAQSDGTVGYAVELDEPAFVLRIPWEEVGGDGPVQFGVAVGSNAQWNDDVPDRGTVEVQRPE